MKIEMFDSNSLDFVEFNFTGNSESYVRCDTESRYLGTTVFHVFIDCFEKANKLYDYFVPTKYNARTFVPLLNELKKKREVLMAINSYTTFEQFLSGIFMGDRFVAKLKDQDPQYREKWKSYTESLINVNTQLIELVHMSIDEDRVLWVIGY